MPLKAGFGRRGRIGEGSPLRPECASDSPILLALSGSPIPAEPGVCQACARTRRIEPRQRGWHAATQNPEVGGQ